MLTLIVHVQADVLRIGLGQLRAARRIEELGFGSIWTPEGIGGKEAFAHQAVLLAATQRIVTGTGIANVWARYLDAMDVAAETAPSTEVPVVRVLTALRPNMLALARDRADGASCRCRIPPSPGRPLGQTSC